MSIKIVCISDSHGQNLTTKWKWPEGDILIHAGDMTAKGQPDNLKKVGREILSLGYRYNIVIAGNHDRAHWENRWSEQPFGGYNGFAWNLMPGIIVLQDDTVEVMGLRIYGSSWIKFKEGKFPFEVQHLHDKWDLIPSDTDILVTHMPPKDILDQNWHGEHLGSGYLRKTVTERVQPKLHVFGHMHASQGSIISENHKTLFVNACLVGEDRKPANQPIVIKM